MIIFFINDRQFLSEIFVNFRRFVLKNMLKWFFFKSVADSSRSEEADKSYFLTDFFFYFLRSYPVGFAFKFYF